MTSFRLIDPFRPSDRPPPQKLVAFIRWALADAWGAVGLATLLSCASGAFDAGTAYLLGRVIDSAVGGTPESYFLGSNMALIGFSVVFFILIRPVVFGLSALANGVILGPNISPLVLSRLHRWTLGQSVEFFDNDFAGRIAQKQMQAANALAQVTLESIHVVAFAMASVVGSIALLLTIDYRVALAFLGWFSVYIALIRWFLPRVRDRAGSRAGARAAVSGQVVDTITNIKTVKLFALDDHEDRAALGAMDVFRDKALQFGWLATGFRLSLMFVAGLLPIILIGTTLWFWSQGQATTGEIVAAGTVSLRLSQMTGWFSFSLMGIYASMGEVEDGMKTLTPRVRLENAANAKDLRVSKGEISLKHVSFAYGREVGGVTDIDLVIHPGEKLGIVGASGAGKSTLVALLLRLYDPEDGCLEIDGQDLREVTQESLRQQIGMVTQETAMFNRSARDNILYGRPDASDSEMIEAAEKAEAHEFIQNLRDHAGRDGYEAYLGERGVKLSGGQRQRIALARAILKDAPILVLDEATSALDSEVEAAIQSALERVMEGKTVLAIAHRLSTISQMDRIIVLDQGRIVEQGTHSELLAKSGLYARYWDRQSGGFIGSDAQDIAGTAAE